LVATTDLDVIVAARERSVVGAPGLNLFIEALALAHRRRDLQPLAQRTFERLDAESGRAWAEHRARRGCSADHGSKVRFARDSPLESLERTRL